MRGTNVQIGDGELSLSGTTTEVPVSVSVCNRAPYLRPLRDGGIRYSHEADHLNQSNQRRDNG